MNWNNNLSYKTDSVPCNDKCKVNLRSFLSRTILTQALTWQFVCQIARYIFHFNQASKLLIAAFSLIYSMTSIKVVYVWCGSKCTTEEVHWVEKKEFAPSGETCDAIGIYFYKRHPEKYAKSHSVDIAIIFKNETVIAKQFHISK